MREIAAAARPDGAVVCLAGPRQRPAEASQAQPPSTSSGRRPGPSRRERARREAFLRHLCGRLRAELRQGGGLGGGINASALASAGTAVPWPLPRPGSFRYWIDYQAFSSPESAALPEAALQALGGVKAGGPPKLDPVTAAARKIRDYGYMHVDKWDLLLSITAKAMLAAEVLRPHQVVSIVPGCLCVSRKTSLVRSLVNAFGPDQAFLVVPRTFKLPDELDAWEAWVRDHPQLDTGLWMLKNNKQRGTGLRLVATRDAFRACFETASRPGMEGVPLYRWYLAQQYVARPLLVGGRKFGLRLWVAVPGVAPLRVYLHRNGLALFSTAPYRPADLAAGVAGSGHITNVAQNENGDVWDLTRLAGHLGWSVWKDLWQQLARVTALVFASALRRIQEVQAQMDLHPRQTFQYFGLDFLLDDQLHPWLMEVNATPSMKVEHQCAATRALVAEQKWEFVRDAFALLRIPQHMFDEDAMRRPVGVADVAQELELRGGLLPLMHLFPDEASHPGSSVPWQPEDLALRRWIPASAAYQQAARELEAAHECG